jgi:hypothetical protein
VIVSVCSDKGSPGVSTLAMLLGLVWPGERVVLDADVAGGDLPFRLWAAGASTAGERVRLAPEPSIATVATAARLGLTAAGPEPFAQASSLGVPVVPGVLSAERFGVLRSLWPRLAEQLTAWPGTVLADLGRLQPGNPAAAVAEASTAVLLVSRVDLESLAHLRDRVVELTSAVGEGSHGCRVGVVVTGVPRQRRFVLDQARQVVASVGSPAAVVGFLAQDPAGAAGLWAGEVTRRLLGSELVRSARGVAESTLRTWPSLIPAVDGSAAQADEPRAGVVAAQPVWGAVS